MPVLKSLRSNSSIAKTDISVADRGQSHIGPADEADQKHGWLEILTTSPLLSSTLGGRSLCNLPVHE